MTLKPCLVCGEVSDRSRCPEHRPVDTKPTAAARGYGNAWTELSKRARRLQPWCETSGATEDLQADHSIEAWHRRAIGLPLRLQDIAVLCGPCNRARGAARGNAVTRGDAPTRSVQDPWAKAKFETHTSVVRC